LFWGWGATKGGENETGYYPGRVRGRVPHCGRDRIGAGSQLALAITLQTDTDAYFDREPGCNTYTDSHSDANSDTTSTADANSHAITESDSRAIADSVSSSQPNALSRSDTGRRS